MSYHTHKSLMTSYKVQMQKVESVFGQNHWDIFSNGLLQKPTSFSLPTSQNPRT